MQHDTTDILFSLFKDVASDQPNRETCALKCHHLE